MSSAHSVPSREDVTALTTFGNPFDEGEGDNTSYAIVSSLLSKVKSTFSAQSGSSSSNVAQHQSKASINQTEQARVPSTKPALARAPYARERPGSLAAVLRPAPPLVSMTPVISEIPSYIPDIDMPSSRSTDLTQFSPTDADGPFSTSIPGFPIQDDTRSIRTSTSLKRTGTASKVIRRLRGDGELCGLKEKA